MQTCVWHKPSWRGSPYPTRELLELTKNWGNRVLEGTNKTLCAPGPRRKEQQPHRRLSQTCPGMSRSLWRRRGSVVACCRAGGTECSGACMGPLEGGRHYLHYLHHSLASGQTTGREGDTVQRINRNWSKDLLSMAPPTRTRLSFRLSQSLLSGNFHKPFIL